MKFLNFKRITIFLTSLLLILNSTLVNAATIGAWTVSNPMAVGASILYDGSKGAVKSSVLITPNASQVVKVLRGGGAGYVLKFAVEQLLDGIDWVMDPANNQIKYKVFLPDTYQWKRTGISSLPPLTINSKVTDFCQNVVSFNNGNTQLYKYVLLESSSSNDSFSCKIEILGREFGNQINIGTTRYTIVKEPTIFQEKTLSLETVAQKVIENAENNNLDAQFAVLAAATNILSEAENDDAKAQPIEDELEKNSKKCPNGESRNIYGQCWICSAAEKQPIESNKNIAKVRAQALGSCVTGSRTKIFKNFDKDEFLVRATAWDTLADARDMENMCWLPKHPQHVEEAQINRKIAETCRAGAAQAIK